MTIKPHSLDFECKICTMGRGQRVKKCSNAAHSRRSCFRKLFLAWHLATQPSHLYDQLHFGNEWYAKFSSPLSYELAAWGHCVLMEWTLCPLLVVPICRWGIRGIAYLLSAIGVFHLIQHACPRKHRLYCHTVRVNLWTTTYLGATWATCVPSLQQCKRCKGMSTVWTGTICQTYILSPPARRDGVYFCLQILYHFQKPKWMLHRHVTIRLDRHV